MGVYKTKEFARFARKAGLVSQVLLAAAAAVTSGDCDADLGGGVFKQRVAPKGRGKSGGFRTILVFRTGGHSFFVHGFAKNEKANVTPRELKALKMYAAIILGFDDSALRSAIHAGEFVEITNDGEDSQEQ